jgi:hypothetical protein
MRPKGYASTDVSILARTEVRALPADEVMNRFRTKINAAKTSAGNQQ